METSGWLPSLKTLAFHAVTTTKSKSGYTILHAACIDDDDQTVNTITTCCPDKLDIALALTVKVATFSPKSPEQNTLDILAQRKTPFSQRATDSLVRAVGDLKDESVLHIGAKQGSAYHVKILLDLGCNVDQVSQDSKQSGATPLMLAARFNTTDVVELLLEKGASVSRMDTNGLFPLHHAALGGKTATILRMLENGADVHVKAHRTYSKTALCFAAQNGNTDAVRLFVEHGATLNVPEERGDRKSPLMYSAENGHLATVEFFVQRGCNVNANDSYGYSPLHYAVQGKNVEVVELLLQTGSHLDARTADGKSPLHLANDVGTARLLVERGCSVQWVDGNGKKPLLCAAKRGLTDVVAFCLENGTRNADECAAALRVAFEHNHSDTVKFLIDEMAKSSYFVEGNTDVLDILAARGEIDLLKQTFEHGTSIDSRPTGKQTLLMFAAAYGQLNTVCFLLDHGAGVNLTYTSSCRQEDRRFQYAVNALHCALANRHPDIAGVLVQRGADVNTCDSLGYSPLHAAAKHGLTTIVQLLFEQEEPTLPLNERWNKLLVSAVTGGHLETVRFVLDQGADVLSYGDCKTVLHFAMFWALPDDFLELTKLLIEHGLDINATSHVTGGKTLLHHAVEHKKNNTAELLVELGIDVNATDAGLNTALHVAAEKNNVRLAKLLINHSAKLNMTTREKAHSPLHKAVINNSSGVVELLLQHGCDTEIKDNSKCTPLACAVKRSNLALVHRLLEHGSDVHTRNKEGRTPFLLAAYHGVFELAIVKLLVEYGSCVDDVDGCGDSSLHLIASSLRSETDHPQFLLEKGADVNKIGALGYTPLHSAASVGNVQLAEFLLQYGADVKILNNSGGTPVHSACVHYFCWSTPPRMVQLLLHHGGDINTVDHNGNLPIHLASKAGIVQLLAVTLQNGNRIDAVDANGRTALHLAECPRVAEFLIRNGADVNALDKNGLSPLAVMLDGKFPKDVLSVLVDHGGDIIPKGSKYGRTILHEAALGGMTALVESLIERGLDVNAVDQNGDTALHRAASTGKIETMGKLASLGANVQAANKKGQTALHLVLAGQFPSDANEARALLGYDHDVKAADNQGNTPLHIASRFPSVGAVECFLESGSSVNACSTHGSTPLHWAAMGIYKEPIVQQLLRAGGDTNSVDENDRTPLHLASMYGTDENVRALLNHGGDLKAVDGWKMTPLHMRATNWEGNPATLQLMIQGGSDVRAVDFQGNTPLHLAVTYTTAYHVQVLLEKNSDVNAVNKNGSTPLHLVAADTQYFPLKFGIVNLLVDFGCNVNVVDRKGTTPLHLAAVFDQVQVAPLLVKHGADVDARDKQGSTPLQLAAAFGSVEILRLLIQSGADVQTRDKRGNTTAHPAAAKGHVEILQVLLKHGCDVRVANSDGETALHFAAGSGQTDVARLLIDNGADCWCLDKQGRAPLDCALMCHQIATAEALCSWLADSEEKLPSEDEENWRKFE